MEQFQVVSYFGNTANADDKIWNGQEWHWNFRAPMIIEGRENAQRLAQSLKGKGHESKATIGVQRYYPW